MTARYIVGDSLTVLRTLPDNSVDLILTSSPFLGLRDYLADTDPAKAHEIGGEPTPGEFIDSLLDVVEEAARVLAPHGTLAWELGDTYSGCVDEETVALSRRGWLRFDQLQAGDEVLSIDHDTHLARWSVVERVNVFKPAERRVLVVEGRGHSSLTTEDHRWYIERRTTNGEGNGRPGSQNGFARLTEGDVSAIRAKYERGNIRQVDLAAEYGVQQAAISKIVRGITWNRSPARPPERVWRKDICTSSSLSSDMRIPIAAARVDAPTDPKWSDALVEAVAWYWTEGHDRKPGVGRQSMTGIYISQSNTANPAYVARIERCLTVLFGPARDRLPGVKGAEPTWCRYNFDAPRESNMASIRLNAAAARVLRPHAPNRVVSPEWLASLTHSQLTLFVETSIDADGSRRADGSASLAQAEFARAEAFLTACVLAGFAASMTFASNSMWAVEVRRNTHVKPLRHPHRWETYEGMVWCPTTANGSWLARRRGQVFFTGNSGGAGGDYIAQGLRDGQPAFGGSAKMRRKAGDFPERDDVPRKKRSERQDNGGEWPLDKSLCMVPELFRLALAYGRNPLTGRETPRWRVRNVIRWVRTNPPVGDLGDKFRCATSDIVVACKDRSRYFDLDAVRTPHQEVHTRQAGGRKSPTGGDWTRDEGSGPNPNGAPPLDWWREQHAPDDTVTMSWADYLALVGDEPDPDDVLQISAKGYRGAHFATWPASLLVRPIEAMCPRKVCSACGMPSVRLTDVRHEPNRSTNGPQSIERRHIAGGSPGYPVRADRVANTLGWSCCGCGDGCSPTTYKVVVVPVEDRLPIGGDRERDRQGRGRKAKTRRVTVVDDVGACADSHWRAGVVLDLFAGTGTTLVVATGHGRDAIGIDLDCRNAQLARERLGMFLTVEGDEESISVELV